MTEITSVDEAVGRINRLTEQILTAAQPAGAGFLQAQEKALRSLADFKPQDAASQQLDWIQSLARAHATFIEEATSAYVTAAGLGSSVPARADGAVAGRIRELNERILGQIRTAGTGLLDGYEKTLRDIADFEQKAAGATQLEWVQAVATSHARFLADLGSTYADAARVLLK
jgi:hypothetical protein